MDFLAKKKHNIFKIANSNTLLKGVFKESGSGPIEAEFGNYVRHSFLGTEKSFKKHKDMPPELVKKGLKLKINLKSLKIVQTQ